MHQKSSPRSLNVEFNMSLSLAPVGLKKIVYFTTSVSVNEFHLIGIEINLKNLFIELYEGH